MQTWRRIVICAATVSVFGCSTVRDARQAQKDAAPKGDGTAVVETPVSLEGRSLEELVAFAMTNRPSVVSAALSVADARLALREIAADAPIASATPWNAAHISASSGYSESSRQAHLSDLKMKTKKGSATAGLSLDLLLWDFGRNDARARAQSENVIAAEESLVQQGYAVFAEVSAAYFALLQNEALHEVAMSNVVQYAEHLAQAEDRFGEGEAQQLDVLRARLDLAQSVEARVAASNDVAVAGAQLMAALGIDAARGDFRSVLGKRDASLGRRIRTFAATTDSADDIFDFARTNAPAVKIARAKVRAASAQVDYAIADLMPTVSASLSLNWTDPLWYWRWGLSAAQSVFTGGRRTTAIDRAVVALRQAETAVDGEEQSLSRRIAVAVAERDNAAESFRSARESVRQAVENLETVKSRYEVGDVSRVEFADAVTAHAAAVGNLVKAFYRGQAAEAALFELAGVEPGYDEGVVKEDEQ